MTHTDGAWYNLPRMDEVKTRPHVVRVRVNEQEREFLERVAAEEDRSVSAVLRLALKQFYERRVGK